jgi:lysophospholipase L1-like esterase
MATVSQAPGGLDIVCVDGDDLSLSIALTENGSAYPWSGVTVTTGILTLQGAAASVTTFTTATPTDGTLTLSLTDTQTSTLGPGTYRWWVAFTESSLTRTILAGVLSVMEPGYAGTSTSTATVTVTTGSVTVAVTGQVTANAAANITVADDGGLLAASNVETALAEIATDVDNHIADTSDAHDASAISVLDTAGLYTATNVETVLAEVAVRKQAITNGQRSGVFAVLGTSISARNQSTNYGTTNNWHGYLSVLTNQRLSRAYVESTGGATLATLRDTNLPLVLASVTRLFPGSCIIEGGTNDVSNQTTGFSSLTDIVTSLVNAGIRPVLTKIPPRSDGSQAAVLSWNARIAEYAKRNGFPVLDMYTPLLDKSTGATTAAYQLDTVHPNELGHYQIALAATTDTAFMSQWGDARPTPQTSTGDSSNLVVSDIGLFLADSNADGVSNSWSQYSTGNATASRNTHDGLTWQRLTKAASQAGNSGLQYTISSGFSVGDVLEMSCLVVSSVTDITFGATLECRSSVPATIASVKPDISPFGNSGSIGAAFSSPTSGYMLRGYYTVLTGTATLRLLLDISGTPASGGYVEYAAVTVRNLTTLGLT